MLRPCSMMRLNLGQGITGDMREGVAGFAVDTELHQYGLAVAKVVVAAATIGGE